MSTKQWLQLSDIHFDSSGYDSKTMREYFLEKCRQLIGIDYLFLTGDFRDGSCDTGKYPDGTIEFLKSVQENLGILPDNTFMVPGNHDICRLGDGLSAAIDDSIRKYLPKRKIPDINKPIINLSKQEYRNLYQQVCGKTWENHFFIEKDELNIINIDTAILCGKSGGEGNLFIDMYALQQSLEKMDKKKPAIAIAHHPFDSLEAGEQEQLEILLKEFNTILFLCGHNHSFRSRNILTRKTEINLWEFVCGTNSENPPHKAPAEIGFFRGYIDTETKTGCVKGYKWSQKSCAWMPNSDFSYPQGLAIDGKYYFPNRPTRDELLIESARKEYVKYLKVECKVRLDGLPPVDDEARTKAFELEKLYVPLRFAKAHPRKDYIRDMELSNTGNIEDLLLEDELMNPWWDGDEKCIVLAEGNIKYAVFSGPGSGKTTWMKRLISVYGIGKSKNVRDGLPDRKLFPIWIKCRLFRDDTALSIDDIIKKIPEHAGFEAESDIKNAFFELVSDHIQNGTALLLVDGLDEIGNDSCRKNFIVNLNQFADKYKQVNIITTSRIVNYPLVIKSLSKDFSAYKVLPFNNFDIERLCVSWYKIIGNTKENYADAQKLVADILDEKNKIKSLAEIPVLLMTLLLVHLWIGKLPNKRAELYKNAIDVLLRTWNTKGFAVIDPDKALKQLAYLAYNMMFIGKRRQTIGKEELEKILLQAREDLSNTNFSDSEPVSEFIQRIKERSALLIDKGLRDYEFSHNTFQEYLAAYAIENRCFPNALNDSIYPREYPIEKHFKDLLLDEGMRETILLTSVLNDWGWNAKDITKALVDLLKKIRAQRLDDRASKISYISNLLMQIVADEAPLTADNRKLIYRACFDAPIQTGMIDGIQAVYNSVYSKELQELLRLLDKESSVKHRKPANLFTQLLELFDLREQKDFSAFRHFTDNMNSENLLDVLRRLDLAAWIGGDWQGIVPDSDEILFVKKSVVALCANKDVWLADLAFTTLGSLCNEDDGLLSENLLFELLRCFDEISVKPSVATSLKFPVRQETIPHIQGTMLSIPQKEKLEEYIAKENNTYALLGYFWFGVLFGAWDLKDVIQKANFYLTAKYFDDSNKETLRKKMKTYLSVLQEADVVPEESKDLVKDYLGELKKDILTGKNASVQHL